MDIRIDYRPSYALAIVDLQPGETVCAEGGAMVSMSGHVNIDTKKMKVKKGGGILGAVKQLLAGESFLINHLTAQGAPGEVTLAPTLPGDIGIYESPADTDLVIQSSSFLGCSPDITLDGEWGGARSFFAGEGLFMLRAAGVGKVLFNSFGGIETREIDGEYVVDTGHIVAFESTLKFKVGKFSSSWIDTFLSGEGLVCRFSGKGKLFLQTRTPAEYGKVLGQLLPPRQQ